MKVDDVRTVSRVGKALAVTAVGGALCHVAYAAGALVEFLDGLPHSYGFFGERLGPVGLLHVRAIMGVLAFASGIGWAISAFHIRPRRTLPGSLLSLGAVALALTVAALSAWSMFPTYRNAIGGHLAGTTALRALADLGLAFGIARVALVVDRRQRLDSGLDPRATTF
ncbi:MAG: hypothetical protein CMN30_10010 [Sandaracinus sp.]|nr:hypothetical protein [Sandaracinus sp.]|tara:strand:+ start:705 stop:1208 length:504 start_codon:yes stop_codon:yes gene_type:complete